MYKKIKFLAAAPVLLIAALAGFSGVAKASTADAWPEKQVRIIVSLPPGSGADTIARFVAAGLQDRFKQPFVVENKTGANSFIAARLVAESPPDGYTIFWASNSPMTTNLVAFKSLGYDPVRDFTPVAMGARFPMVFVVRKDSPLHSISDLTNYLREHGDRANYGSGTATYRLAIEQYQIQAGVSSTHVPYKGTSAAVVGLASGDVDFSLAEISSVMPLIKDGRLRALAVTGKERLKNLPDVPTMGESGVPGYEVEAWVGGFLPAKTPRPVADKVSGAVLDILRSQKAQDYITGLGGIPTATGPADLRQFQEKEIARLREVAGKIKLVPE